MNAKRLALCLGLLISVFSNSSIAEAPKTFTFGVVPQQAASKLAKLWSPIFTEIGAQTGLNIRFRTAPNIPEFEARLAAGEYDLAYMNPYHYTVYSATPGYVAIAKQQGKRIQGIFVVHKDSAVDSLEDLADARLAFPAPAAFAASVLPQAALNGRAIPFKPVYVSSHDSVYRAVAKGLFPAGGGIGRTFSNVDASVRDKLKVFWRTEKFTPHAIAAHPRIDEATRQRLQTALLSMSENERGKALLANIKFKGIEAAADADWDDVRKLDIKILSQR